MKGFCLEVWGDYACFTRPEMKVERVSYDVVTPSSARAIFEAILWKPAIKWHVTKIEVIKPIRWASVRRNEVGTIFASPTRAQLMGLDGTLAGFYIEDKRVQRAAYILRDVRYRIHAWFEFIPVEKRNANHSVNHEIWADAEEKSINERNDENEAKYASMFERRAKKGQCFHRPYLGTREFPCNFILVDNPEESPPPLQLSQDLGWMLYDMDYSNPEDPIPRFFKAKLENGVLITDERIVEVRS